MELPAVGEMRTTLFSKRSPTHLCATLSRHLWTRPTHLLTYRSGRPTAPGHEIYRNGAEATHSWRAWSTAQQPAALIWSLCMMSSTLNAHWKAWGTRRGRVARSRPGVLIVLRRGTDTESHTLRIICEIEHSASLRWSRVRYLSPSWR